MRLQQLYKSSLSPSHINLLTSISILLPSIFVFPHGNMSPHNDQASTPSTSQTSILEDHSIPGSFYISPPSTKRLLTPGVYTPNVAFFHPNEDVDAEATASHAIRQAQAGIRGLVTQGSNGESVHLTHPERALVTSTTRHALDNNGFKHVPVIVGCGAQSVRETIQLCEEGRAAGGDYALILPPNYYAPSFAPNSQTILEFFRDVADKSPIPVLIYNYPGAVGGIDLSSDIIIRLAQHPNIVGVKLTCGNVGKLARIVSATCPKTLEKGETPPFIVLGGLADLTIQSLSVGGHGIIAGLGNIVPKTLVRLMDLSEEGKWGEARDLQEVVARGDWAAVKGGIVGTKSVLETYFGYGGLARRPLGIPAKGQAKAWEDEFAEIVQVEKAL